MAKNWYILHVLSGKEHKVVAHIEKALKKQGFNEVIGEVKIPQEDLVEMREGKKRTIKRKFFPGYVLLELDLPDGTDEWKDVCYAITSINGVTGFLGASSRASKPKPIPPEDAKSILQKMGELKTSDVSAPKTQFVLGESIKVVDGPFNNFNGTIEEINNEKGKIKVKVEIFGRSTPVELDFLQVEKI